MNFIARILLIETLFYETLDKWDTDAPIEVHALCVPRRACSVLRRARPSRGGTIRPEANPSVLRLAYMSRGRPICPEAGQSIPRRAHLSQGGPIRPEAGLSRANPELP